MRIDRLIHSLPVSRLLLRLASWMVPGRQRREWLAEWQAELWQVCHAHGEPDAALRGCEEATAFSLGAFPDAYCLRRDRLRRTRRLLLCAGSAARCGLLLAGLAGVSMLACLCLPGTSHTLRPLPYRDAANLAIVSSGGYAGKTLPGVRLADYESWRTNGGNVFREVAFYRPATQKVGIEPGETVALSVARASDNLFDLLNLPLPSSVVEEDPGSHPPKLLLSWETWQRIFYGEPGVIGRTVTIAGRPVLIAGIVPENFWRLPGHIDGWLLEDENGLDALPAKAKGFVLAQMRSHGSGLSGWQSVYVDHSNDVEDNRIKPNDNFGWVNVQDGDLRRVDHFDCISVAWQFQQPFTVFLFTLFLACLALPATTPLPLGDYPEYGAHLPFSIRARRWIFLAAKFILVAPTVFFCSVDLAYSCFSVDSAAGLYLQFGTSFLGLLFAFRWVLRDQRQRCPVCLRLLSNPARVGEASRNFLAWNGTELICAKGHGLLHIPELPTSWCGTQRWLYLDASWHSLFSDSYIAAGGIV